jgi:pilus assembly protein CpaF
VKRSEYQIPFSASMLLVLEEVQRELARQAASETAVQGLDTLVQQVALRVGYQLNPLECDAIVAQCLEDGRPFGPLQELVHSPQVSDIIVSDYLHVAVQCGRRTIGSDVTFPSQLAYEQFVERLLRQAGAAYSTKRPIADGVIGGFARVHAVHRSLCGTGPYLTIRLNRFPTVTVDQLVTSGMAPREVLAYLESAIRAGLTVLVVGEVGTGKTTLARALAACIPAHESILVIEDTPELKLSHPQVRSITTRDANFEGEGRVCPSECIRAGMRMAMNRIVFGEMRDAEAAESFIDVCASGHPGLSTLHARSALEAITRLELFLGRAQRGVGRSTLLEQIVTAVQIVVFVDVCRQTGLRRIMEVREIGPVADGVVRHREIFSYQQIGAEVSWRVGCRQSAWQQRLESSGEAFQLANLPAKLIIQWLPRRSVQSGERYAAATR